MDCPHLCESVKIGRDFIKSKKSNLLAEDGNVDESAAAGNADTTNNKQWRCSGKRMINLHDWKKYFT